MTFSIVARCPETGMFGMAISSSSPAVAARCMHAQAGIGVVASQNVTDPSLGPLALSLMADGHSAMQTRDMIRQSAPHLSYRQLLIVDNQGETAIHSGSNVLGNWAEVQTTNAASGGNLLANEQVPQAMLDNLMATSGHLGDRLVSALQAGLAAGGEAGPVHSAGMMLVDRVSWPVAELRCDWTEQCPIEQVAQAWAVYKPQLDDYVARALNPAAAPSYGVPGNQ